MGKDSCEAGEVGAGADAGGDAGDDSGGVGGAVIGSHHRAAVFTASPPGSIQAACAPVTSHQVCVGGWGGERQHERREGTTGSC